MIRFSKVLPQLLTLFYSSFFSIFCQDPTVSILSDKEYSNTSSEEKILTFVLMSETVLFVLLPKPCSFFSKKLMNFCKI